MLHRSLLFVFLSLLFVCCSGDECTIDDWKGTYIGTKNCAGDIQTDYAFEITENTMLSGSLETIILLDGQTFSIDGCEINGGGTLSSVSPDSFEGSLDGNELRVTANFASGSCTWIATRQ